MKQVENVSGRLKKDSHYSTDSAQVMAQNRQKDVRMFTRMISVLKHREEKHTGKKMALT